ncbi:MAG: hypothetical protein R2909_20685 [Gemmatimonadales bacterium]
MDSAPDRDFYAALAGPSPAFVLEVKPRSSAGRSATRASSTA